MDCSNEEYAVKNAEGCDHSFILKEDIGYVCCICGFIQRAIETIIEFQYAKVLLLSLHEFLFTKSLAHIYIERYILNLELE